MCIRFNITRGEWILRIVRRKDLKQLDVIAAVLVVVGALNWGLVAVARFDLVAALFGMSFGDVSAMSAVVYALVGAAGLYQALFFSRVRSRWAQPAPAHAR